MATGYEKRKEFIAHDIIKHPSGQITQYSTKGITFIGIILRYVPNIECSKKQQFSGPLPGMTQSMYSPILPGVAVRILLRKRSPANAGRFLMLMPRDKASGVQFRIDIQSMKVKLFNILISQW